MGKSFWTSDPHFFHANIIKYCSRPWANVYDMNEALIENWNSVVDYEDDVFVLGDVALLGGNPNGKKEVENILRRLNGNKYLIYGNHDKQAVRQAAGFIEKVDYKTVTVNNQYIVMSHYPMVTWHGSHRNSWMLHGHCHGTLARDMSTRRLDVGVDVPMWNYTPVSFEQLKAEMDKVVFKPNDHHGTREM